LFLDEFRENLLKMARLLCNYAYFYLSRLFTLPERYSLHNDLIQVFNKVPSFSFINFNKYFGTGQKMQELKRFYFDPNSNFKELKAKILSEPIPHNTTKVLKPIFPKGIELYKTTNPINEIAINYCNPNIMALATDNGILEIKVSHALKYGGDNCITDWYETLHRFDNRAEEINQSSFVNACLEKLNIVTNINFEPMEKTEWYHKNTNTYYQVISLIRV